MIDLPDERIAISLSCGFRYFDHFDQLRGHMVHARCDIVEVDFHELHLTAKMRGFRFGLSRAMSFEGLVQWKRLTSMRD